MTAISEVFEAEKFQSFLESRKIQIGESEIVAGTLSDVSKKFSAEEIEEFLCENNEERNRRHRKTFIEDYQKLQNGEEPYGIKEEDVVFCSKLAELVDKDIEHAKYILNEPPDLAMENTIA